MGKTKTAFVSEVTKKKEKSSETLYREKKEKQAKEAAKKSQKAEKIHIAGLKGGQRVKIVEAELPPTKESKNLKTLPAQAGEGLETQKERKKAPKVRGEKYQAAKAKIDKTKLYPLTDAVRLVKETSYSRFDGAIELHLVVKKVGTSAKVTFPFWAGKEKRVEVASEETTKKIQAGKIDFDVLLATHDMMPRLVPFAKVLGPRGLMPNPKNGTLIKNVKESTKFSGNTLNLKTEKEAPLVHLVVGKVSQKDEELVKNAEAIFSALGGTKQIIKAYTKSTMGPSVKIEV